MEDLTLLVTQLLASALAAGTPLLFAVLGGILIERSGVIQLGAEGLMLMGAVTAAGVFLATGSLALALAAVVGVSALLGGLHGLLTVTLRANQIVAGLALTLFGGGLAAYLGKPFTGQPLPGAVPRLDLAFLEPVPVLGPVLAHLDALTWFALALVVLLALTLGQTAWGLRLKAVGDSPATADVMGIPVVRTRYLCVVAGSVLMGLGGADLLLVFSPTWIEGMTAGRGWIAVALIIFARWNPWGALAAATFFGLLDSVGFRLQLAGSPVPSYFLKMIPYLLTVVVLILVGWRTQHRPSGSPLALGIPYLREQRF